MPDSGTGGTPATDAIVARYSARARAALAGDTPQDDCGSGDSCFGAAAYQAEEEVPEAALRASLGCGNPLAVADLRPGETVLDLGSGGGLDVLLSARRVGPAGTAYGLDASEDMLALARANARKAGVGNARFLHGRIEHVPLDDAAVDVVISNCVINLAADKARVLAEAFRVLRPGGRLGVSDIIAEPGLDPGRRAAVEQDAGCPAGTLTVEEYRRHLLAAGFTTITVTVNHQAAPGLHSAIVRAGKPASPPGTLIRPMRSEDAAGVLEIYQAGLDTGDASFETSAPSWERFDRAKLPGHRYVVADATTGTVLGWIAASAVSDRCVYAGVVEHSVYVHPDHRGRGLASALLRAFVDSTESAGIWTVQSGVFPENTASLRLHTRAGFRTVGVRERIGRHHGRWRDVVLLERRSPSRAGECADAGGQGSRSTTPLPVGTSSGTET
ncbi:GNAT family N-acetyltransferase [Actinomadura nitritigenes]|uniref:GNAT family N-acetyltransferase n=1 Tax=Actinomadura nitritigenes TaxID=134602 RepID=UPI00367E0818